MDPKFTIENWSVAIPDDPYVAPELRCQLLQGMVHTDKGWDPIHTSPIKGKIGDLVLTRSDSLYALGKINPEYEALFPNARQRLFDTLPEISIQDLLRSESLGLPDDFGQPEGSPF